MKIGQKIKVQGFFAEFLGDAGDKFARVKYGGKVRTVPRSSVRSNRGRPPKKKKRKRRRVRVVTPSGREPGMAYTMAEYNHWHSRDRSESYRDTVPHEDNKVCLSPSHEAAYLEVRAAKQAAGESTWGLDQQSRRYEQRTGAYRQGRTGMMGVGR